MPDVLQRKRDFRQVEAIDMVLKRVAVAIAAAKREDDWQRVRDGRKLCDAWLDKRLKADV